MAAQRRALFFTLPLLAGAVLAALWVGVAGGGALIGALRNASPLTVLLMVSLTAGWLVVRFVRWQFLLRRAGIRLPARPSLATYLAALPGTATPAYVGEIARSMFIRRRFGVPLRLTTATLVTERLFDIAALGLIATITAGSVRTAGFGLLAVAAAAALAVAAWSLGTRIGLKADGLAKLRTPGTVLTATALSLVTWLTAAQLMSVGAVALGLPLGASAGTHIFATSTLFGAVTLLPAGAGATGSAAILQLENLGIPLPDGIALVSLVRLTSTGATLSVGILFLWRELRNRRPSFRQTAPAHFDEIASDYHAQWSAHVWDHLLARKTNLIASALETPAAAGLGLDLGCGLGIQMAELARRGYGVVGMDPSVGLLAVGGETKGPVLAGDARALPFRSDCFDFVYAVGVFHHLPGPDAQRKAFEEVLRVLKPGGLLLLHETNPHNPLFRFYMGYVFPLLKKIDEGTEWWLDPDRLPAPADLHLEAVTYFTFIPDFTPRRLMGRSLSLEQGLERSGLARYSAHYMAVLRKADAL
jgi:SAM-dependent methyltransferase